MRGATPPLPNTPSWRGVQFKHGAIIYLPLCVGKLYKEEFLFLEENEINWENYI
jgi:hypothetical protein